MKNVKDIYQALAVRINYPVEPTYRCMQKIIGYINLLMSLATTPQVIVEVALKGQPHKKYYQFNNEKIAYMKHGCPAKLNPDGTIDTIDETAYVIRTELFQDLDTGTPKKFVTNENDVLSDEYYLQPLLTSLYLTLSGVQPAEAVCYINDACTRSVAKVDTKQINTSRIKRRL